MISLFQNAKLTQPIGELDFNTYLVYIKDGHWQDTVLGVRAGRFGKEKAQAVTASGTFKSRSISGLLQHSGLIALDFDAKDNADFPADQVATDPYVLALHRSISGYGWVAYIKIEPERHADAYVSLEQYFANTYQAITDPSGKDVSRLRFVSYDPDLTWNPKAALWKKYIPKKLQTPKFNLVFADNDFDNCLRQIKDKGLNIADDYHTWVQIGFAIAGQYGEQGRAAFHTVSGNSPKYDPAKCDAKYDNCLKTGAGRVKISTFFWHCKQAGVTTRTKRTEHIEATALVHKKKIGISGGATTEDAAKIQVAKILKEVDHIEGDDVQQVIDQVFALNVEDEAQADKGEVLPKLIEFVKSYDIKYNEVTGGYELNGKAMNDRDFNSLLVTAKQMFGDRKVSKDLLYTVVGSEITRKFHPFKEYFTSRANLKPSGVINQFLECIEIKTNHMTPDAYKKLFVKKWLMSIVASSFGTYSVMVLVMTGNQGVSKTRFFRSLLPPDLRRYMADAKLDNLTKDDLQMLCCNLLICDDEFGGKSKKEYKLFKELTSKDRIMIRPPYGRNIIEMQRYAVLCGTSNEEDIINDPTGNRRIIPLNVVSINYERLETIDRDALFMELYHEFVTGQNEWMLTKDEVDLLQQCTTNNEQANPEVETLLRFFKHPDPFSTTVYMTNTDIKDYLESRTRQYFNSTRLGIALKKLGFVRTAKKISGTTVQVYQLTEIQQDTQNAAPF